MKVDMSVLLPALGKGMNCNCTVAAEPFQELEKFDYGIRQRLDEGFDFPGLGRYLVEKVPRETLVITEDELNCSYILLKLSDGEEAVYIFGPFYSGKPISNSLRRQLQKKCGQKALEELLEFFQNIRVIDRFDVIPLLTSLYNEFYPNSNLNCVEFPYLLSEVLKTPAEDNSDRSHLEHISEDLIRERYILEERLMRAVAVGDSSAAISIVGDLEKYSIPKSMVSSQRSTANHVLSMNMLCRMAVSGTQTVHPYYVEQLYLDYMDRAEEIVTGREARRLILQMVMDYCECVRSHGQEHYSPQIQRVVDHIHLHLEENLSLKFFAQMCNMSASYLSNLFREETGATLTEYINQMRVEKAASLLLLSDESIAKIGERVGFMDENYFTRVFKRVVGVPPSVYRRTAGNPTGAYPIRSKNQPV